MPEASREIVRVMEEAGVEIVFGLPGGGTMAIFDALYDSRQIRAVLVRHEHAAAIMADAWARATGRPAVIMGQGLFMGSNATFGIMEAYLSSSPMLILTDTSDGQMAQLPVNQSGVGEYGSVDLLAIFRAQTKYTTLATTPKEAVLGTQLALKHATTGRSGPACVLLRSASLVGEADPERSPRRRDTRGYLHGARPQAAPADIERAVDLLLGARRPVIVAGHGARMARATDALRELAEGWGIPVATTYKGKSAIAETHPLALGMVGVYGARLANAVVGEADVVLVIGAMLRVQDTAREKPSVWDPGRQKLIQIDVDPHNAGWTFPVECALIGDARAVLEQLLDAAKARGADAERARRRSAELGELRSKLGFFDDAAMFRESSPVTPQRLVRVLHEALDPATLIALDAGNNRVWMSILYQCRQPDVLFAPGGTAGMAWGLPAALGLKLARPERPVACVTGDGGFMMSIQALSTAVQYEIPVTCVVLNDYSLGMVRQHQHARTIASEFFHHDHAELARAFGAHGIRVDDSRQLPAALREAQACDRATVIDVITDRAPSPDDYRAVARGATET